MEPRRRSLSTTAVYGAALGIAGWTIGLRSLGDNSFLWHLRTGELILDEGIPRADPYSYTAAGTGWVAQSWLVELVYGVLDRVSGPFAIRVFAAAVLASIAVVAFMLASRLAHDRLRAAGLTVVTLAGVVVAFSARPLLVGTLLLLVLVWIVELPASRIGRHEQFAIPIVMWLWINVHGSWVLGFVYLALHLTGRWLDGARPWNGRERRLLVGSAIASIVVFLNPYGWRLVLFPVTLLGQGENLRRLREWGSPEVASPVGVVLVAWLVVLVVVIGRRRVSTRDLVVVVPFVVLALAASRNAALAPLVVLPVLARAVAREGPRRGRAEDAPPWFAPAVLAVVVIAGAIATVAASREADFDFDRYPVAALAAIDEEGIDGRVLTTESAAGYVILTEWPERRVFFDDRMDMYPASVTDAYLSVFDADADWDRVLDEFEVEAVVWPNDTPLASVLEASQSWERIHRDRDHAAWTRAGSSPRGG